MGWRRYGAGCPDAPSDRALPGQGWGRVQAGTRHPCQTLVSTFRGLSDQGSSSALPISLCDLRQAALFSEPWCPSLSSGDHSDNLPSPPNPLPLTVARPKPDRRGSSVAMRGSTSPPARAPLCAGLTPQAVGLDEPPAPGVERGDDDVLRLPGASAGWPWAA